MLGECTDGCQNVAQTISAVGHREVGTITKSLADSPSYPNTPGSSADPIVGQFAVTYHDEAAALGIDLDDLYSAMLADGENTPPNWDIEGRQADAYMCAYLSRHPVLSSFDF